MINWAMSAPNGKSNNHKWSVFSVWLLNFTNEIGIMGSNVFVAISIFFRKLWGYTDETDELTKCVISTGLTHILVAKVERISIQGYGDFSMDF